jgi:hypothetical protein
MIKPDITLIKVKYIGTLLDGLKCSALQIEAISKESGLAN